MPKVSVILTSYNHDKYIREAINSILQQTFVDFELIIWDDASIDNSWEIIQSYNDSRIRAFRNSQNKGFVFGINKAIFEAACGEYIAIHHSNDIWELDKLEKQVSFLDVNEGIGAVFSNAQPINELGLPLTDSIYCNIFNQTNRSRHEWLRYFFLNGNGLCHPSILIRKQCYIDCGAYRDMLVQMPDFDMWIRLCVNYEIHVIPEQLLKFRVFDGEMNHPMIRIRDTNEYYKLLQQYRTFLKHDNIFKIFPNFSLYDRGEFTDLEYVLSRVCLESDDFFLRHLLAIDILFDLLNNPVRKQAIEKVYGFSSNDFIALTGQCDVFARQELFKNNELILDLKRIASGQGEYIQMIEKSLSWKMTRPLRTMLGSASPLGIIGRRVARFFWGMLTQQTFEKTDECQNDNTEKTTIPPFSSDNGLSVAFDYSIEKPITTLTVVDNEQSQFAQPSDDYCHIAPPSDDYCFVVPFNYSIEKLTITPSIAVVCHLYYHEMLAEFKHYLLNIPFAFDLYITTDTEEKKNDILNGFLGWDKGTVEVRIVPNRGRDIAPKLISCRDVYDRYEFFLHIHSKKSLHMDVLAGWRSYLLETLLGSEKIVTSIFEAFNSDPLLGMIAPEHFDIVRRRIGWGSNFDAAKQFSSQFGVQLLLNGKIDFPSGSMFWGRSAAIKPLLEQYLATEDFPIESNQTDATLAHVIERIYFFVCEQAGYRWIKIASPILLKKIERVISVESRESLLDNIKNTQYGLLNSRKEKI